MNGNILHKFIVDSGIKVKELEKRSGIPESTIYTLYNKKDVPQHYLDKIESAGVSLQKTTGEKETESPGTVQKALETIVYIESKNKHLEGRVSLLEKNIKYIMKFLGDPHNYEAVRKFIGIPFSGMSICVSDKFGVLEFVNEEFTNQTGYEPSEVIGKKPGEILQGERTQETAKKDMAIAIKKQTRYEGEVINYNKMSEEIICKLIIAPIKNRNNDTEKLISLAVFKK